MFHFAHIKICIIFVVVCQTSYGLPAAIKIKQVLISRSRRGLTAGIGDVCKDNNDCGRSSTHCANGYCVCNRGFIQDKGDCKQVCTGCPKMNECNIQNTLCVNNKCECDYGYTLEEGHCKPVTLTPKSLGTSCVTSGDCRGSNVVCGNKGKCECEHLFVQVIDKCLPERNHAGSCESTLQCPPSGNDCCNQDHTCVCKEGTVFEAEVNQACYVKKGYNESCEFDVECHYDNGKCTDSVCECLEDHGPNAFGDGCVATIERAAIEFELPNITFSENLNNPASAEFTEIQELVETIKDVVSERSIDAGIDITDVSLGSFSGIPSGSGTTLVLYVEAINSELDPSYSSIFPRDRRVRRSTASAEISHELLMQVNKFVYRIRDVPALI